MHENHRAFQDFDWPFLPFLLDKTWTLLFRCGTVGISDHCAIFGIRKLHRLKFPPPKTVKARNYKNYDPELFPWVIIELESEPDNAWNSFKSLPWITPTIKDLMKKRYYHHKKAVKTNKSFTGAATKNCVTLCRWNFVRKKPVIIQISSMKNRTRVNRGKLWTSLYQRRSNTKLRMPQPLKI